MEAITSKVLCKDYKTLSGYKSALTKYINSVKLELDSRLKAKKKGWIFYLGEPIDRQIYQLQEELHESSIELKLKIKKHGK